MSRTRKSLSGYGRPVEPFVETEATYETIAGRPVSRRTILEMSSFEEPSNDDLETLSCLINDDDSHTDI